MNKKKVLGLSIVLIIGLAGFIGTLGYYQALLVSKDSQVLSLSSIIEQSNIQISNLTDLVDEKDDRINNLSFEVMNLTRDKDDLSFQILNLQNQVESLQINYGFDVDSYELLREKVNQRFDPTDPKLFITPNDNKICDLVQSITGGWSDPSDFDEFWTDAKDLYFWVRSNIEYISDGLSPILPVNPSNNLIYITDMWQFAEETIDLEKGDCEDQGILLCSMIRCYTNQEYATDCIWIDSDSESSHIGVQIPVSGNKLVIFDPAGNYYSKDFLGNIVFNDIAEEINSWLNDWKGSISSDVYVKKIFSDNRHVAFSSMNEYLTWMQNYGFSGIVSQS